VREKIPRNKKQETNKLKAKREKIKKGVPCFNFLPFFNFFAICFLYLDIFSIIF